MHIEHLFIQNLRIIQQAELNLDPGFNLLLGLNGAGKTSVLEAVHVLATGRSFRSPSLDSLRQQNAVDMTLTARVHEGPKRHQLGLRKLGKDLQLRLDGTKVERMAELAQHLAVLTLHADSDLLIQGGPQQRRRWLDWWLFHTEPGFLPVWRRYQRLLKQRNAALRNDQSQLSIWNDLLAKTGEEVANFRRKAADELMQGLVDELKQQKILPELSWSLYPGWNKEQSLHEALQRTQAKDIEQGLTSQGPHRAELRLMLKGREAREVLSRGQQKWLTVWLLLRQAKAFQVKRQTLPIILLDDLAAELDTRHHACMLEQLISLGGQVLLTALEEGVYERKLPSLPRRFVLQAGKISML